MSGKMRFIVILAIISITITLIFKVDFNSRNLAVPESEKLNSITFINVIDGIDIKRVSIYDPLDMSEILEIISRSEWTDKESISDTPDKTEYTRILFNFKSGGSSIRSMYSEDDSIYVDQPYVGVYKLKSDRLNSLQRIIENGDEDNISM